MGRIGCIVAIVLSACVGVSAHDFWLSADPARPTAGGKIIVTANVGEDFPKSTGFTMPDRVEQWRLIGATADVPVTREFRPVEEMVKGKLVPTALATDVSLSSPGAYLGVMTIAARVAEMKGPSFTEYLEEEGLDQIVAARKASGDTEKAAKERYARYAKVAVRNGAGSGTHLTRAVGLAAEFVPSADPTLVRVGQSVTVQLLTAGKPVAGAAVALVSGAKGPSDKGRTDANGRVSLKIEHEGAWLIKTVHMVKSPQPDADWESYWVTLVSHTAP